MTSPWSDLDRPPLSERRLARDLAPLWPQLTVVAATGSTNADVAAAARSGAPEGLVVIAEQQTGGRGRLDRVWEAPARSSLLLSALVRPAVAPRHWPLLPLLTGLAIVEALRTVGELETADLKWPNDILVEGRKLAGVLCERVEGGSSYGGGVVVGIGLNVSTRTAELPVPTATSLALEGGVADRETLAKAVLRSLAARYRDWCDAGGAPDAVMPSYRTVCGTIGSEVELQLPGGNAVRGTATDVDDEGRIVLDTDGETTAWSAGDVVHLRRA